MSYLDKLFSKKKIDPRAEAQCLFSSPEKRVVTYGTKGSRAETIIDQGIGQTTYGSGQPPDFYNTLPTTTYDGPSSALKTFPVVYGCVTAISDAISSLGVKVYKVDGAERTEETTHPFYALFSRPNPYQGSYEFLEELSQSLDALGNAFIGIEKVGGTHELYLLNPIYVAIIPDPKIKVKEYRYVINGQAVVYKPEEIIHIKYTDLDDPYFGMPSLVTAKDILTFEENRLSYANQFFVNGAIPSGVLETEQNLGDNLLKKLRGEWSSLHKGVGNSHKVAILQGGLKYRPISSPLKELDFAGLKKISRDEILTVFRVPESVLGSQEQTGGSEGKESLTAFWRGCIVPRLKRIESSLNRGLAATMFGDGQYVFEFNLKDVVALQEDKVQQASYLEKMVAASIMTPNEARAVIGLPRSEEEYADQLLVSNSFFGNQMMPSASASASAAASADAGPGAETPAAKPQPIEDDTEE